MTVWAVRQADGTFAYQDDSGKAYSPEDIKALPKQDFGSKVADLANNLYSSFTGHSQQNPDDAAKYAESMQIMGVDPKYSGYAYFASKDIEAAAMKVAEARQKSPDDWNDFVNQYPKTAEYLNNSRNMALSWDDLHNLGEQESTLQIMGDSINLQRLRQERADIGNQLLGSGGNVEQLAQDQQARLAQLNEQIRQLSAKMPDSAWTPRGILTGLAGMVPSVETGAKYAAGGAAAGAAIGAAGAGVGVIPGAISGAGYGFRIGMAKDFAATEMGNKYLDELEKGTTAFKALEGAAISGAGNALLGTAQVGKWLKRPGVTGEVAKTAEDKAAELAKTSLTKEFAKSVGEQAAIGAGMTATDLLASKVSEGQTTNWQGSDLATILAGGLNMVPIGVAMQTPGLAMLGLKRMGTLVDQSATAKRIPDVVADKINSEVAGTPLENVSITGRELAAYLDSLPPEDSADVMNRLGIDEKSVSEAIATGGDVDVKLGNLEVLPTKHREALLPDVRIGDGVTTREVQGMEEAANRTPAEEAQTKSLEYADLDRLESGSTITDANGETYRVQRNNQYKPNDVRRYTLLKLDEKGKLVGVKQNSIGDIKIPITEEAKPIAQEIGLNESPEYVKQQDAAKQQETDAVTKRQQAEESPSFQRKLSSHLEEVKKQIEQQLEESPLYQASDKLKFNLQLFGDKVKNARDIAKRYIDDRLTDKQKAVVDMVAEEHGFSSGDELAQQLKSNQLKDNVVKSKLEEASKQFKDTELGNVDQIKQESKINEATIRSTAHEAAALRGIGKGEHVKASRAAREADIKKRQVQAEKEISDKISKAKDAVKKAELEQQLKNLKKQHKQEIADLNKEHSQEIAGINKEQKAKEKQAAAEAKQTSKEDLAKAKEWLKSEKVSQQLARKAETGYKAAMEYAKYALLGKPINEAMAYGKYASLARKAARAAEQAYRKGNYEEAANWKETEMLNHAMTLEAMDNYKYFNKQKKYLTDVQQKKKSLFKTDENFNQVGAILERFGINRKDYGGKTETLQAWSDRMNEMLGTVDIPDWLYDESTRKPYSELTRWELADLTDAIKNIQKVANQEKTSLAVSKGESLDAMRIDMINEMDNNSKDVYRPEAVPGAMEKAKDVKSKFMYSLRTMANIIEQLQGWKEKGSLYDFFLKPMYERADLESNKVNSFRKDLESIWGEYSWRDRRNLNNKKAIPELGTSVPKSYLISMALNIGNAGNRERLFGTMPVGLDAKVWNEATVMKVLNKYLDARDWKTVQRLWDSINSIWPELSKFHAEMTGFEPIKVEALPFDVNLPNGETIHMSGGYYPLKEDPRSSIQSAEKADLQGPLYNDKRPGWKAMTRQGSLKSRTGADYAVSLDLTIMYQHMLEVIHDLHFRDLVADYRRMVTNKDFQATVQKKLGPEGVKVFSDYVANVADGEAYKNVGLSGLENTVRFLRVNAAKAAITLRVGVLTQNLSNLVLYPGAVKDFGVLDATAGMLKYGLFNYIPKSAVNWKAAAAMREEVYKLSPFMRDRRNTPDYTLNDLHKNVFREGNPVSEFGMGLLAGTDDLIAIPMWKQAYGKELGRSGDQKAAAQYADDLIRKVNGSGRKYDVSGIMRSKSEYVKALTSFMGFMNVEYNRWVKETGMVMQSGYNIPRYVGFIASRVIVFQILSNLLSDKTPDDKEDPAAWVIGNALSYPTTMFPLARDVAPLVIDKALGLQSYGYRPPIAFNSLENLYNLGNKTTAYMSGKGKTTGQDVAESFTKTAAYGLGAPDQFNAWFWNAYDIMSNGMDPDFEDIMKRRPKKERK